MADGGAGGVLPGGGAFNPLSVLDGIPSLSGGDAAPAFSSATSGLVKVSSGVSAPFTFAPGTDAATGFGPFTSRNIITLALIGGAIWLLTRRR